MDSQEFTVLTSVGKLPGITACNVKQCIFHFKQKSAKQLGTSHKAKLQVKIYYVRHINGIHVPYSSVLKTLSVLMHYATNRKVTPDEVNF
jgi:hypothetical protein